MFPKPPPCQVCSGFLRPIPSSQSSNSVFLCVNRCLHSLSRSVQQLRTSFHDHAVWKPLMKVGAVETPPSGTMSPANDVSVGNVSVLCQYNEPLWSSLFWNSCCRTPRTRFSSWPPQRYATCCWSSRPVKRCTPCLLYLLISTCFPSPTSLRFPRYSFSFGLTLTQFLTYSLTHLLTYSLTHHSLTHSLHSIYTV